MRRISTGIYSVLTATAIGLPNPAKAEGELFALAANPPLGEAIVRVIDPVAVTATDIGGNQFSALPELEFGNGKLYASDSIHKTTLQCLDPATGMVTGAVTLTFPLGPEDVLTALEFVGSTLYGGFTEEDDGGPSLLVTVNVTTGIVTLVGETGIENPLGGLAMSAEGTMYTITAGGSEAQLFTIDLTTGAATLVGTVLLDGAPLGATALEFGCDGVLYALPSPNDPLSGHLLSIDPATGIATDLGDLGARLNALTLVTDPLQGPDLDLTDVTHDDASGLTTLNYTSSESTTVDIEYSTTLIDTSWAKIIIGESAAAGANTVPIPQNLLGGPAEQAFFRVVQP